jgi:hypothetical protein
MIAVELEKLGGSSKLTHNHHRGLHLGSILGELMQMLLLLSRDQNLRSRGLGRASCGGVELGGTLCERRVDFIQDSRRKKYRVTCSTPDEIRFPELGILL